MALRGIGRIDARILPLLVQLIGAIKIGFFRKGGGEVDHCFGRVTGSEVVV